MGTSREYVDVTYDNVSETFSTADTQADFDETASVAETIGPSSASTQTHQQHADTEHLVFHNPFQHAPLVVPRSASTVSAISPNNNGSPAADGQGRRRSFMKRVAEKVRPNGGKPTEEDLAYRAAFYEQYNALTPEDKKRMALRNAERNRGIAGMMGAGGSVFSGVGMGSC